MMYCISYDIADPKRLRLVAKLLENYGIRIQKSFFQCDLNEDIKNNIIKDILSIIDKKKDSILVYPLCNKCLESILTIGNGSFLVDVNYEII